MLVVSELVTNAVHHAQTAFSLDLSAADDRRVRIEVFDRDPRQPVVLGADDDATGGRGIRIVSTLAVLWGATIEERNGIPGKVVWAEVST